MKLLMLWVVEIDFLLFRSSTKLSSISVKYLNFDRKAINFDCDDVRSINDDVSIEFNDCLNKKFSYAWDWRYWFVFRQNCRAVERKAIMLIIHFIENDEDLIDVEFRVFRLKNDWRIIIDREWIVTMTLTVFSILMNSSLMYWWSDWMKLCRTKAIRMTLSLKKIILLLNEVSLFQLLKDRFNKQSFNKWLSIVIND